MAVQFDPVVKVGLRMQLKTPQGQRYYYQNYSEAPLSIGGKTWQFLPMSYAGAGNYLELDNTGLQASLPNDPLTRNLFMANDGLKKAIIILTRIFIDEPSAPAITDLLQVRSSSISYPSIEVELQSPLDAFGGNVPNKYFIEQDFPELPVRADVNIR